jgi:xylulose-5-phosphate/fructose-6-phosphate phosphoketolase
VLPILHLNGYKISNPTVLARIEGEELEQFLRGCGWAPLFVEGDDPDTMHERMATVMESAIEDLRRIQANARDQAGSFSPAMADDRVENRPKAGRDRKSSTGCRSRGPFGRTRYPCWWIRSIRSTSRCSKAG